MSKRKVICSQNTHCLSCPISVRINNNTIKYCYKADNVYNFERRLYFLSLLIEKKFIKEMNKK